MKKTWRILAAALLLALMTTAAFAEKTISLTQAGLILRLPDGAQALYAGMPKNDPALSAYGLTAAQAERYLNEQGAVMEAYSTGGMTYSVGIMDGDGRDFNTLTESGLRRLVSEMRTAYSAGGATLSDAGLYQGEGGNFLRCQLTDGTTAWTEYLFTMGGRVVSLQAFPESGRMTSAAQQEADLVAVSLKAYAQQTAGNGRTAGGTRAAASLVRKTFPEEGLTIGLPDTYAVYTRAQLLADTKLSADLKSMVRENGAILALAVAPDGNSEIWLLARRAAIYSLDGLTETQRTQALSAMASALTATVLDPQNRTAGGRAESLDTYRHADALWDVRYAHWNPGDFDEYALSYAAVRRGREIGILFVRYDGQATEADLSLMNGVAKSAAFTDVKTSGAAHSAKDAGTGVTLTVPAGWTTADGGFAPERTGGLSLLLAAADVSQQSPETAPGNIDTTWFSRRDVAALYPVSPEAVRCRVLNGEVFYAVQTTADVDAYGVTAQVPETDYVTVREGVMFILGFAGPADAAEAADPEALVSAARFPRR